MNDALLLRIADAIEAKPDDYMQSTFGVFSSTHDPRDYVCQAPCCIAGWTLLLEGKSVPYGKSVSHAAAEVLDIPTETMGLFSAYWPVRVLPPDEKPDDDDPDDFVPNAGQAAGALRRLVAGELSLKDFDCFDSSGDE